MFDSCQVCMRRAYRFPTSNETYHGRTIVSQANSNHNKNPRPKSRVDCLLATERLLPRTRQWSNSILHVPTFGASYCITDLRKVLLDSRQSQLVGNNKLFYYFKFITMRFSTIEKKKRKKKRLKFTRVTSS